MWSERLQGCVLLLKNHQLNDHAWQCLASQSRPCIFGTVGDAGPALEAMATSALAVPQDARIGGLKLEMPEKYTGSRIPVVSGWLTKMERYFRLMKYPTDIWVDVIATRITNAAKLGWTRNCKICSWDGATPGPAGTDSAMKWSRLSPPCLKWSMREGS